MINLERQEFLASLIKYVKGKVWKPCVFVRILQVRAYSTNFTIYYRTTRLSRYMLEDCATPSVQVNKSSLVVHRDQEGGKTYTPRRREYYYYLCTCKCMF